MPQTTGFIGSERKQRRKLVTKQTIQVPCVQEGIHSQFQFIAA
jgi:hypothetical protein